MAIFWSSFILIKNLIKCTFLCNCQSCQCRILFMKWLTQCLHSYFLLIIFIYTLFIHEFLFIINKMFPYRHSFPRVLLSSALCRCGYWSASFLRAACAQTMKAFMGLLTWGLLFRDPFPLTGMGTKDQSYPLRTWETASRMQAGNRSSSSESSFLPKPASRDPWPSEPVGEDGASESDSSWDMELFVPDGLHGWSPTHLSCSSVIFNIISSAPWGWKSENVIFNLKTKMKCYTEFKRAARWPVRLLRTVRHSKFLLTISINTSPLFSFCFPVCLSSLVLFS